MKKTLTLVISLVLIMLAFTGCYSDTATCDSNYELYHSTISLYSGVETGEQILTTMGKFRIEYSTQYSIAIENTDSPYNLLKENKEYDAISKSASTFMIYYNTLLYRNNMEIDQSYNSKLYDSIMAWKNSLKDFNNYRTSAEQLYRGENQSLTSESNLTALRNLLNTYSKMINESFNMSTAMHELYKDNIAKPINVAEIENVINITDFPADDVLRFALNVSLQVSYYNYVVNLVNQKPADYSKRFISNSAMNNMSVFNNKLNDKIFKETEQGTELINHYKLDNSLDNSDLENVKLAYRHARDCEALFVSEKEDLLSYANLLKGTVPEENTIEYAKYEYLNNYTTTLENYVTLANVLLDSITEYTV